MGSAGDATRGDVDRKGRGSGGGRGGEGRASHAWALCCRHVPSNYEVRLRQFVEKLAAQYEKYDDVKPKKVG